MGLSLDNRISRLEQRLAPPAQLGPVVPVVYELRPGDPAPPPLPPWPGPDPPPVRRVVVRLPDWDAEESARRWG